MAVCKSTNSLVACAQLKAARGLAGWTQADLANVIGVNERQIRFWEKRIPGNQKKRRAIEHILFQAGIELISHPTIGVRLVAREFTE